MIHIIYQIVDAAPRTRIGANAYQYSWKMTMSDMSPALRAMTLRYRKTLLVLSERNMIVLFTTVLGLYAL